MMMFSIKIAMERVPRSSIWKIHLKSERKNISTLNETIEHHYPVYIIEFAKKDTDAGWFDLEDTENDQKRKFKYVKKYNLRHHNYRDPNS